MLIMLILLVVSQDFPQKMNITNIINISLVLATFSKQWINIINISQVLATFWEKSGQNPGNVSYVNSLVGLPKKLT